MNRTTTITIVASATLMFLANAVRGQCNEAVRQAMKAEGLSQPQIQKICAKAQRLASQQEGKSQPASSNKNGSHAGPNATVLVIAPQKESGGPGQLTFSTNNNTLFFFDKPSQKGLVIINNTKYDLTTCSSEGSSSIGSYKLSGKGIVITAPNCKYGDEGGDCFHGKC